MAVQKFLTTLYANNIYIYGTYRLTARDGFPGVKDGYYTPVEQSAANTSVTNPLLISRTKIDQALANGWLTQQEYDETISYIPVPTAEQQALMDEVATME